MTAQQLPDDRNIKFATRAVKKNLFWLDKVLWSGSVLCCVILYSKLSGLEFFESHGLRISTPNAWIALSVFTACHFYVAWLFIKSLHRVWVIGTPDDRVALFEEIRASGNIYVRGFEPRTRVKKGALRTVHGMSLTDPAAWVSYGGVILGILAVVPMDLKEAFEQWWYWVIAALLAFLNWRIGANWIIAVSELAVPKVSSNYHDLIDKKHFARIAVSGTSGPVIELKPTIPGLEDRDENYASDAWRLRWLSFGWYLVLALLAVATAVWGWSYPTLIVWWGVAALLFAVWKFDNAAGARE